MAFKVAGSLAFKDAMKKADPVLLEPIMKVDVTMPEEYMGDVIGDINSRRGRIEGMEDVGGGRIVHGYVPLSEMFGIPQTCVPEHRVVVTTPCSSITMRKFRKMYRRRSWTHGANNFVRIV